MLATAFAAAAACASGAAPVDLARTEHGGVVRTSVVVCGRPVRRAVLRGGRGTVVRRVRAAGAKVAWVEVAGEGRARAVVLDAPTGRVERRVAIGAAATAGSLPLVAVNARGDVAAAAGRRVVLAARGRAPLRLRSRKVGRLSLLRAQAAQFIDGRRLRVVPLPGRPSLGRCRPAAPFVLQSLAADLVLTKSASFDDDSFSSGSTVRACRPADGSDRAIASAASSFSSGTVLDVIGSSGPWAVLFRYPWERYEPGGGIRAIVVHNTQTGVERELPGEGRGDESDGRPRSGEPLAVTDGGGLAWVQERLDGRRLVTIAPDGTLRDLDRFAAAPITRLRADGDTMRWTRDGVDRSAPL